MVVKDHRRQLGSQRAWRGILEWYWVVVLDLAARPRMGRNSLVISHRWPTIDSAACGLNLDSLGQVLMLGYSRYPAIYEACSR